MSSIFHLLTLIYHIFTCLDPYSEYGSTTLVLPVLQGSCQMSPKDDIFKMESSFALVKGFLLIAEIMRLLFAPN